MRSSVGVERRARDVLKQEGIHLSAATGKDLVILLIKQEPVLQFTLSGTRLTIQEYVLNTNIFLQYRSMFSNSPYLT